MQSGKIVDIYVKENNITVVWYPPQTKEPEQKAIPMPQPRVQKKQSIIATMLIETVQQVFSFPPQTTEVIFTKPALEKMGYWGLSEASVKDVVLHGEVVRGKDNMISKKYNGYDIGVIAPYNKATNTYVVLSAWKRGRR